MWEVAGGEGQTEECCIKVNGLTCSANFERHCGVSAPKVPDIEAPLTKDNII